MNYSPHPYLDPGSGSIVIQLVLAALLGIGVFVRSQWSRVRKYLGMKEERKDDQQEDENVQE